MDKIKTIIIEEGQLIQDSGITKLTDDYIELIPANMTARYLKVNIMFKNWIPKPVVEAPIETDVVEDIVDTTNETPVEEVPVIDNEIVEPVIEPTVTEVVETIDKLVNDTRFPFIKINGEVCPIMIQEDFEIKSEDNFQINSLMINREVGTGHIAMILVNYRENK